ncbi:uncharacterized protein LOC141601630 [Silene latifolia]|uniref:uncharacterized protein LOC141601630 n=1 Tax=Silene latifolia TaxID=37657 RepID=UPI003D776185
MHQHPSDIHILEAEKMEATSYLTLQKAQISFFQQKAKAAWLKGGDENTNFYHNKIKARNIHNKILHITDMNGLVHVEPDAIEKAFLDYYKELLGSSKPVKAIHIPTVKIGKLITDQLSSILMRPVTAAEIKKCIFSIPATKLPGLDGLSDVLLEIVSPNQGGFVKGRHIGENILICQDIVRLYNRKTASPRCLIKIDLKKAYEYVEWYFLAQMIDALKFRKKFIKLLMVCVTTTSFSLAINGNSFGFFHSLGFSLSAWNTCLGFSM